MKLKDFTAQLDEPAIVEAIKQAEMKTAGEIRVFVTHQKVTDPLAAAQAQFHKLGMDKTAARNGVLIFFAPLSQQFAVIGDRGIHEKCGNNFWSGIGTKMQVLLEKDEHTAAIVLAIQEIATLLAQYFPFQPGDRNELPNEIARD